jgi:hypothetical protein
MDPVRLNYASPRTRPQRPRGRTLGILLSLMIIASVTMIVCCIVWGVARIFCGMGVPPM